MKLIDEYLDYLSGIKRYSPRTIQIYKDVLEEFCGYIEDEDILQSLNPQILRSFEVFLMEKKHLGKRTVVMHISALSSFAKYLVKQRLLESNPVKNIIRPKTDKPLPIFYRADSMASYFEDTKLYASEDALTLISGKHASKEYEKVLKRVIISILFYTGIRRSELISLKRKDADFSRKTLSVRGKGDKEREIPLEEHLIKEIKLYLQARETLGLPTSDSLLLTPSGIPLYPTFVDRAVKAELGKEKTITSRKSPHVLRHTLATELLNDGVGLNSIKEMLGHSSLAATQVYTHNSIEKLKNTYNQAHPLCQDSKK